MARWRQAVELAMTDEEIGKLKVISRSRTEPASRVERAQMLLAYGENPRGIKARTQGAHHGRHRRRQPTSLSSILGPTNLRTRPDMIRTKKTLI
jgi:hypothetical protein